MSTKQAVGLTVNSEVMKEVIKRGRGFPGRRKKGNSSWVVGRDMTRLYSTYDSYRPKINKMFNPEDINFLKDVLRNHSNLLRDLRAEGIRSLVNEMIIQGTLPDEISIKLKRLELIELITLVDMLEWWSDEDLRLKDLEKATQEEESQNG